MSHETFLHVLLLLALSVPCIQIHAQPGNNNFANATDITSLINSSCTTGGAYTTQSATPDQTKPACWGNGPNNNVWFKFTATSTGFINVKVKFSGSGETMQNPGNTYYIAVDNYVGYIGSFDLCLSDVVDYDFKQGALDVTGQMNSVTSGGTYTNFYATPDQSKASCWGNGPNNNVWFKFTAASADITAGVKVSGAGETMQYPYVEIYDASMSQLACKTYTGSKTDLSLTYTTLTPGNTYYIVVDNYVGYAGSFDLAVYNNLVLLPLQLQAKRAVSLTLK